MEQDTKYQKVVTFRVPDDIADKIQEWQDKTGRNRSDTVLDLVRRGLGLPEKESVLTEFDRLRIMIEKVALAVGIDRETPIPAMSIQEVEPKPALTIKSPRGNLVSFWDEKPTLTIGALSDRLGVSQSTVRYRRYAPGWEEWCRGRDPDGFFWDWDMNEKEFVLKDA